MGYPLILSAVEDELFSVVSKNTRLSKFPGKAIAAPSLPQPPQEKNTRNTFVYIPLETFIRYMHKQVKLICSELSKLPDTNYKVVIIKDKTSANTGLRILYSFMFHFRIWTVGWTKETMSGKS